MFKYLALFLALGLLKPALAENDDDKRSADKIPLGSTFTVMIPENFVLFPDDERVNFQDGEWVENPKGAHCFIKFTSSEVDRSFTEGPLKTIKLPRRPVIYVRQIPNTNTVKSEWFFNNSKGASKDDTTAIFESKYIRSFGCTTDGPKSELTVAQLRKDFGEWVDLVLAPPTPAIAEGLAE